MSTAVVSFGTKRRAVFVGGQEVGEARWSYAKGAWTFDPYDVMACWKPLADMSWDSRADMGSDIAAAWNNR